MPVKSAVRLGNACAALSDEDFENLVEIAHFEVSSNTFLTTATAKIAGAVSAAVPDWVVKAIESALTPILLGASKAVSRTHLDSDEETWAGWFASYLSGEWFHKGAATLSGAIGGSAGLPTAIAEIGVSTALIVRAIQDVARTYGEDLTDPLTIAECVAVLGKGGPRSDDDALDEAYWVMRAGLKKAVTPELITKTINSNRVQQAISSKTIEQILKSDAFRKIIARFGVSSQAALAEKSVPVVGAILGAFVNYQFIAYYQNMAHVVYRLKAIERKYEDGQVDSCYQRVLSSIMNGERTFLKAKKAK